MLNPLATIAALAAFMVAIGALALVTIRSMRSANKARKMDDAAQLSLGAPLALVGTILGAVVTYLIVAALFPTFADAVADVNTNLTDDTVTFGDATTDAIKPTFAIVVGIVALIGIVGLILRVWD